MACVLLKKDIAITLFNVYCPECPPGGTIGHPGGQQKMSLPFGNRRDIVAFNGTDYRTSLFRIRPR